MLARLFRVYGVESAAVFKCMELPRELLHDPSQLSATQIADIFGPAVQIVNMAEEQAELEGMAEDLVNGKAKRVRQAGQVDLAFMKSHEFSALLSHMEPLKAVGDSPYTVETKGGSEAEGPFATDDLLALYEHLMEIGRKGLHIQRYKGLGEMNAEQLLETTMDPENRTLLKVMAEDEGAASEMFVTLMGDLVEPRKEFIERHAAEVQNLDV
jgi:DNA gyrase subunit B